MYWKREATICLLFAFWCVGNSSASYFDKKMLNIQVIVLSTHSKIVKLRSPRIHHIVSSTFGFGNWRYGLFEECIIPWGNLSPSSQKHVFYCLKQLKHKRFYHIFLFKCQRMTSFCNRHRVSQTLLYCKDDTPRSNILTTPGPLHLRHKTKLKFKYDFKLHTQR